MDRPATQKSLDAWETDGGSSVHEFFANPSIEQPTAAHSAQTKENTMNQYDGILRTYADSGLRTAEDWNSLGRDIAAGAVPATSAPHRGVMLPLFNRHQTLRRARTRGSEERAAQS